MAIAVNQFKKALQAGRPQIGIWSALASHYTVEILAGAGFDWIMLDTEHAPNEVSMVLQQLQAVAADPHRNTSAVVRPAWNDHVLIKRFLDIGAETLLIPYVQSREEAAAAVRSVRYPPLGIRGVGGATVRATRFGRTHDYMQQCGQEICLLVQVETAEALENLESIASVDGVDGIFIGPADLAASMGYPGQPTHPVVRGEIDKAIRRIAAFGKAPGILMVDEARAKECLALGALFVAVAVDMVMLARGAEAVSARYKGSDVIGA
ncbi:MULTISPECIES: aldolase/citrate lyase family protein [Cupriavidus]|uniref:2,4-dihydroxyhept-2-enedioate aldolase n=1 Tax=Cupriavidus pinatubonensis (strain JMP 134 / LMG 1197) TaxID=264198 RepID=Q46NJ6_CUPPJ|nr:MULTISPECIES: aldolase/citrate lyase family protein [Cupriavidus]TPQ26360.1 4-hydroxy-2-oxo-heptane-1,7-dioate aldolase [Cupriavidus pinatubonensis]